MAIDFPTSYDSAAYGEPQELVLLTLDGYHNDTTTTMAFNEDISGLETPGYITFLAEDQDGDFEIVKYTAKPTSYTLTVERHVLGSEAQEHQDGENAAHDPVSEHFDFIREVVGAVQKYQGLVGLKSALPGTCDEGEAYTATDTEEFLRAVAANTWRLINNDDHGNYAGLDDDDHDQYHTPARKGEWHSNTEGYEYTPGGEHLTSPTTHDHSGGANMGDPAAKIHGGPLSGLPENPISNRHVYFATDTADLYVGNGGDWVKYAIVPKGAILVFETSCPDGWTRYVDMDDKTPRGAPTGVWENLQDGGSTTHAHQMLEIVNHSHGVPAINDQSTSFDGEHHHNLTHYSSGGGATDPIWNKNPSYSNLAASTEPVHNHIITFPVHNTSNAGTDPATTDLANTWPPYKKMIFCEKD